jgi:hypothetical protein
VDITNRGSQFNPQITQIFADYFTKEAPARLICENPVDLWISCRIDSMAALIRVHL